METKKEQKVVLTLCREEYTSQKTGEQRFNYFVKGFIRTKEEQAWVAPKVNKMDKDFSWKADELSYVALDRVFGDAMSVDLLIEKKQFIDEKTGEVSEYVVYTAFSEDEYGEYECNVQPIKPSDRAVLETILKQKRYNA